MERFFYSEGYNRALDDVIMVLETFDLTAEELIERLEKYKIRDFNEVEF